MKLGQYDCAVVGDWHLAFVTAGVLSHTGLNTLLVNHQGELQKWNSFPDIPVSEPGLFEMFQSSKSKNNLDYSNNINQSWSAQYVWLAVDTPVDQNDNANIEPLLNIIKKISQSQTELKALIISSQIPIGFCQSIEEEYKIPVVYIPENLRLGKGISTFLEADRTVIGASSSSLSNDIQKLLSHFKTEFLLCDLQTAEMIKHANNAFLATSISFANELARLGEHFNVDNLKVAQALKLDKRIGQGAYVMPGLGFAGGTLPRDLRVLLKKGNETKIPMRLIEAVLAVNEDTTLAIVESIVHYFDRKSSSNINIKSSNFLSKSDQKNVLIMGYTYKADTDTLRRSLSLDIADLLISKNYNVFGYDPIMNSKDLTSLKGKIQHFDNIDDLTIKPDVILLMTSRPEFKNINWNSLAKKWIPSIPQSISDDLKILVFDSQNFIYPEILNQSFFRFKKLWGSMN